MIKKWTRKRHKQGNFKPNRAFVAQATEDYIRAGGTIKKVKLVESETQERDGVAIHEFLCDYNHPIGRNYPKGYFD